MRDSFFDFFDSERIPLDPSSSRLGGVAYKTYPLSARTPLPKPTPLAGGLSGILTERQTCRDLSHRPLPLDVIGNLLYWSAGHVSVSEEGGRSRRPYPSGGARYPIECYVALRN